MELGVKQVLQIQKMVEHGAYLGEPGQPDKRVLLPRKQVPEGAKIGDELEIFLYKDSEDRMIATTNTPLITMGELNVLKVVQAGNIGAFLDWGLEKDLFLPFKEQSYKVRPGDECLVALYLDKSSRLCATMRVYDLLREDAPYKVNDKVSGVIYDIKEDLGAFVAVDNRYHGLVPAKELFGKHRMGEKVEARVTGVREDGRLNLSIRQKAYLQMDEDAQIVWKVLEEFAGVLPFNDKASPAVIQREFGLSKNAFKRAVGKLLKEGKIQITETSIRKIGE